jgi:hypothetical protein
LIFVSGQAHFDPTTGKLVGETIQEHPIMDFLSIAQGFS